MHIKLRKRPRQFRNAHMYGQAKGMDTANQEA